MLDLFFIFRPNMDAPPLIMLLAVFLVGLALGSFVQAAALRLNRNEDIIFMPSVCRLCTTPLSWWQNLPLLGWLLVRGRCAHCGGRFSPLYVLVELAAGMVAVALFWLYPPPLAAPLLCAIVLMMICGLTDFERMLLHLPVMLTLGGAGLAVSCLPFWPLTPIGAILGMLAPAAVLILINVIYRLLRGADGFGSGDYWLLAAVGAWLGPVAGVAVLFVSALMGAVVGLILIGLGRGSGRTAIPFGVFISLVFIFWPVLNIVVIL